MMRSILAKLPNAPKGKAQAASTLAPAATPARAPAASRRKHTKFLLASLALAALSACAPEAAKRYHTAESEAEAVSLLNEREYGRAIFLLESRLGKNPQGPNAFLLGQAYLGRAGIEPLAFAAAVAESEPGMEATAQLFPDCPTGRLAKVNAKEWKCLLKRVYLHGPAVDQRDFARARALFRRAYPDPATAPEWANALIGLVETISLVKRVGDLYLYSQGHRPRPDLLRGAQDLPWLQEQGRLALEEADQAINRARFAGEKISTLLTGSKGYAWFERAQGTMRFAKALGLARFFDFARENLVKPVDEIRYGETLNRLREILGDLEKPLPESAAQQ